MNNNDIFKKLRVALRFRDDEILEILELVDFKISKGELGAFFRNEDHPNYRECGDQILRNFLNGLVLYLRGTKENSKDPGEVLLARRSKNTIDRSSAHHKPNRMKHDDKGRVTFKHKPGSPSGKNKS